MVYSGSTEAGPTLERGRSLLLLPFVLFVRLKAQASRGEFSFLERLNGGAPKVE